jgi:hypothetical protein
LVVEADSEGLQPQLLKSTRHSMAKTAPVFRKPSTNEEILSIDSRDSFEG